MKTDESLKMIDVNSAKSCIAYYPIYTKITGSVTCGILLSQIMYWYKKMEEKEFYKTNADLESETGLTSKEIKTAKNKLRELGLISIVRKGLLAKSYYTVNETKLQDIVIKFQGISDEIQTQKHPTSWAKKDYLDGPKGTIKMGRKGPYTTETTTYINLSISSHSDSDESNDKNKRVRLHSPEVTKIQNTLSKRSRVERGIKQPSTVAVGNLTAKQPFSRQVVEKFTADQLRLNLRMKSIAVTHEIDPTWIRVIFDNFTGWWAEEAKPKNKPSKSQAGWERAWTHWVSKAPKIYHSPQPGSKKADEVIMDLTDYPRFLELIKNPNTRYRRLVDRVGGIDHCMTNGFPLVGENPWEVISNYE